MYDWTKGHEMTMNRGPWQGYFIQILLEVPGTSCLPCGRRSGIFHQTVSYVCICIHSGEEADTRRDAGVHPGKGIYINNSSGFSLAS